MWEAKGLLSENSNFSSHMPMQIFDKDAEKMFEGRTHCQMQNCYVSILN